MRLRFICPCTKFICPVSTILRAKYSTFHLDNLFELLWLSQNTYENKSAQRRMGNHTEKRMSCANKIMLTSVNNVAVKIIWMWKWKKKNKKYNFQNYVSTTKNTEDRQNMNKKTCKYPGLSRMNKMFWLVLNYLKS